MGKAGKRDIRTRSNRRVKAPCDLVVPHGPPRPRAPLRLGAIDDDAVKHLVLKPYRSRRQPKLEVDIYP